MDAEIFVHGVPSGEDFWGKEEDRNYFGTFYDHSSDELKFLIQTRMLNGKPYCYYNYLVYKTVGSQVPNVVGNDGRDGSYFGITLRLDAYCKDIANMFRILDTVFNVYIMGSVLKMEKSKLKYVAPNFSSISSVLETTEKATLQLVQNAFSIENFAKLDGFAMNGGNYPKYNLLDCTADTAAGLIKQYSKLAVSPYYPSSKESALQQKYNEQLQGIKQQYEARLRENEESKAKEKNEITATLSTAKSQVTKLQHDLEQKDKEIADLRRDASKYSIDIKNAGQSKKISQIVTPIVEPITELARVFKTIAPDNHSANVNKKNDSDDLAKIGKAIRLILPIINTIILLIIAFFLLKPAASDGNETDNGASAKIEALKKENHELRNRLNIVETSEPEPVNNEVSATNSKFDINKVVISIVGGNENALKVYSNYTVVVKNGTEGGILRGEGCEIYPMGSYSSDNMGLIPMEENFKIIYQVGNQKKEKQLKAKKPY